MSEIPFTTRLSTLFEIFYGLAIASGIQQVAPQIVQKPLNSIEQWELLWCFVIAISIAVGDWITYYINEYEYRYPIRIVIDILFTILIFFLFPAANLPHTFLLILVLYFGLSAFYPYFLGLDSGKPWDDHYENKKIRTVRAGLTIVSAAGFAVDWIPFYVPLLIVTAFVLLSWYLLWIKIQKKLTPDAA